MGIVAGRSTRSLDVMKVRPRFISILSMAALAAGCFSASDYVRQRDAAFTHGSGQIPVDARRYRVHSQDYPTYRVSEPRQAPTEAFMYGGVLKSFPMAPQAQMLPSDNWNVVYRFGDFLLIYSVEFNQRECAIG